MVKAQKHMNAEEAMSARRGGGEPKRRRRTDGSSSFTQARRESDLAHQLVPKAGKLKSRFSNYTPLNVVLEHVLMEIRDDPALKWLGKLKAPPAWQAKGKYCHFYRNHNHDTNDCFNLKEQIEELIQRGRLRRFMTSTKTDEAKITPH